MGADGSHRQARLGGDQGQGWLQAQQTLLGQRWRVLGTLAELLLMGLWAPAAAACEGREGDWTCRRCRREARRPEQRQGRRQVTFPFLGGLVLVPFCLKKARGLPLQATPRCIH